MSGSRAGKKIFEMGRLVWTVEKTGQCSLVRLSKPTSAVARLHYFILRSSQMPPREGQFINVSMG